LTDDGKILKQVQNKKDAATIRAKKNLIPNETRF